MIISINEIGYNLRELLKCFYIDMGIPLDPLDNFIFEKAIIKLSPPFSIYSFIKASEFIKDLDKEDFN